MSYYRWAETMVARFGKPFDFNQDVWQQVLEQDLGMVDEWEVIRVLEWMQSKGQSWKPPKTAKDLIVAIRTYRKQHRDPDMPEIDCELCTHGWVSVWPRLKPGEATLEDYSRSYVATVPCKCAAGDNLMETAPPYDDMSASDKDTVGELRDLAIRQHRAQAELMEETPV